MTNTQKLSELINSYNNAVVCRVETNKIYNIIYFTASKFARQGIELKLNRVANQDAVTLEYYFIIND